VRVAWREAGHRRAIQHHSYDWLPLAGTAYQELGANYFDQRNALRTTKRLVKRLKALGHRVMLASPSLPSHLNPTTA
jgi:hypothetical protein